jgi:hypothetical protein
MLFSWVQGLRASVRSRAFWERGLARAWHRKVCPCFSRKVSGDTKKAGHDRQRQSLASRKPYAEYVAVLANPDVKRCPAPGQCWSVLGLQAGVTEAVVDNYRLPQLVNGWEAGLLAFLRARVVAGKFIVMQPPLACAIT